MAGNGSKSRDKGSRAEYQVRDILRKHTGLQYERCPGSGAYSESHALKADIYLPSSTGKISAYSIEVKHYKDTQITPNLFNATESTLEKWLEQCNREAEQMNSKPLLVFRHDRGKWLVAVPINDALDILDSGITHMILSKGINEVVILLLSDWLSTKKVEDLIKWMKD